MAFSVSAIRRSNDEPSLRTQTRQAALSVPVRSSALQTLSHAVFEHDHLHSFAGCPDTRNTQARSERLHPPIRVPQPAAKAGRSCSFRKPKSSVTDSSPRHQFAVDVVRKLRDAGYEAYFAGGCVRDLLLGRPAEDFDVASNATPDEVQELFGHRQTLTVGASFGVVIVKGGRRRGLIEIATFRTESGYSDGRRPDSVAFSTAEEDACRRDFTINGMFYDPIEKKVLDFVKGQADLDRRLIRAIGDPEERISEDKLRMLRAIRFAATLDFDLDPDTATVVREHASEVQVVSAERIAQEMRRMLSGSHRSRAMRLFEELGLLAVVFPELEDLAGASWRGIWNETIEILDGLASEGFELGLAALLHSLGPTDSAQVPESPGKEVGRICRRLKLANDERSTTLELIQNAIDVRNANHFSTAQLKRLLARRQISQSLELAIAWSEAISDSEWNSDAQWALSELQRMDADEINPEMLITGDDLKGLGGSPGRHFKVVLDYVRDAQLNGEVETHSQALELAREALPKAAAGQDNLAESPHFGALPSEPRQAGPIDHDE